MPTGPEPIPGGRHIRERVLRRATHKINAVTVAAVACCAFVLTDVSHECLGHGGAYVLLGGRSFLLTTTRVIADAPGMHPDRMFAGQTHGDLLGRLFSIAGPFGSFLLAAVSLLLLRVRRYRFRSHAKLFLLLCAAFSLFWACGYLVYSGVLGRGDYFEVVRGNGYEPLGRTACVALGSAIYLRAMRLLGRELKRSGLREEDGLREAFAVAYVSAACIASLGAAFDPRGPVRIVQDALPETILANAGMLWLGGAGVAKPAKTFKGQNAFPLCVPWLAAAVAAALFYTLVLGPGIHLSLGR